MCDRIADTILDSHLANDPDARTAIEVMGGHGKVYITGEVSSHHELSEKDYANIVHGITDGKEEVETRVVRQSPEIARGVDTGGAGDQGIMIGYATGETRELLPLEVILSRSLCKMIYDEKDNRSDGKTQVTLDANNEINAIVVSWCGVTADKLREYVDEWLDKQLFNQDIDDIKLFCNPAGDWNVGGFEADSGLTGRKLAVDNYGPRVPIGGGAFSGKDYTKVDRSGAYMARWLAVKTLMAKPSATECLVRLAYAIGYPEPVEVSVLLDEVDVGKKMKLEKVDLTPKGIVEQFDLKKPQYAKTAEFGHFGHGFNWDIKRL
jgi:S-adenosylmethionine synthetase